VALTTAARLAGLTGLLACAADGGRGPDVRRERLALIRDTAAQLGVTNAALLAGIAESETHLAHCWSEATYACRGPDSPSCDGPVIAGSADGPCDAMQGGLGMFQFDAGTWSDTLATYGDAVLTIEGNTAQAVSFVIDKVRADVPGAADWLTAAAWLNRIPLIVGDPDTEAWAKLMACRYNGCCADTPRCASRAAGYRDHAIALAAERGEAFWRTEDRCAALPADGVIDDRSACYLAAGDPRGWRREPGGHGGAHDVARTTTAAAPAQFARWRVRAGGPGRFRVEVLADGGAARARYEVAHAGARDEVVVDQAAATGYRALGDFAFAGTGDEYVALGDAADAAGAALVFDAVRLTAIPAGARSAAALSDGAGMLAR